MTSVQSRVAATLVLTGLVSGCLGTDDTGRRVGDAGVTVQLPSDWHATQPFDGNVVDPVTRLVVASAPITHNQQPCQVSHYRFADDAVAVVLVEWVHTSTSPGARFPGRPARFTPRELAVRPPPAIECFDGPGGSAQFAQRTRTFGAYLLLGREAPAELAAEARAVLDTLLVEER